MVPGNRRASLDHIQPLSLGGTDDVDNLRWVTLRANHAKSDMNDAEFLDMCRRVVATLGAKTPRKNPECPTTLTLIGLESRPI